MKSKVRISSCGRAPWAVAISGVLLASAVASQAATLYGVTGAGGAASGLYTIDTGTGAATFVGNTGFTHMTGLDFDPTTGVLYGIADSGFSSTPTLVTIDKNTGSGTVVGSLGFGGSMPDISFAPNGQLYGWTENGDRLVSIDKLTGAGTIIGSNTGTAQTGLAFDNDGDLFMKSGTGLYQLNPATGFAFWSEGLSPTVGDGMSPRNALEFNPDTGTLYTITSGGFSSGSARPSFLATIDIGAGTYTDIGDMGVNAMAALAFDATAVPETGTTAAALFFLSLVGMRLWRNRTAASQA